MKFFVLYIENKNQQYMRQVKVRQLIFAVSVFSTLSASAQTDNSGNDKQIIKLRARISEDSAKLVKLKGMVPDFEKQEKTTADNAQQSADANRTAADKLSNDPENKKLARKADDAASQARSDAKKARIAVAKLDDLNKDIKTLTRELGKQQTKLDKYQQNAAAASAAAQPSGLPPAKKDSVSN